MQYKDKLSLTLSGVSFVLTVIFASTLFKVYFAQGFISYSYLGYSITAFILMVFLYWISSKQN